MNYYKSTELAEIYGVSRRTVTNWIEQTRSGRLWLELAEDDGKTFIAKTPNNQQTLRKLVPVRHKFLNKRSLKTATPTAEFYELYNRAQILDIISNIENYGEIPRQYNYFDQGANFWDVYTSRLYKDNGPNILNATIKLLDGSFKLLDGVLENYNHVNIVDLGPGNSLPIKSLLEKLLQENKLKRYIAIDISEKMLEIAKSNIKKWFKSSVTFEGYTRDFSYERFADIIAEPPSSKDPTINLVLLLGGTLANLRAPSDVLNAVHKSMRSNDLLFYTCMLDSPETRHRFSFATIDQNQPTPPQYKFIIDLLGIDASYYKTEWGFNEKSHERFLKIVFRYSLKLTFKLPDGDWHADIKKGSSIILWRARHESAIDVIDQFRNNGFYPIITNHTPDHDYLLVVNDLQKNKD